VYVVFAGKAALLDAVIRRAIADNRAEGFDAVAAAPPDEIPRRLAARTAALMARAAHLIALGESTALMDAELRPLRDQAHRRLRAAFRALAARLDEAGLLRGEARAAADTIYALTGESIYLRLVEQAGWSARRYARWLEDMLLAAVVNLEPPAA
jgi:hypothetical protein